MRLLRASCWILGGVAIAAASLAVGAWLGPAGAGPGLSLAGIIGGLWAVERGMGVW